MEGSRKHEGGDGSEFDPTQDAIHTDIVGHLLRILAILRRRWLVIVSTTAIAITGAILLLSTLQPQWKATATVVLHMSGSQVLDKVQGVGEAAEGRWRYDDFYTTQLAIMQSRSVAERALRDLSITDDPMFLGTSEIESAEERERVGAEVDRIARLRSMIAIEPVRDSRVVRVSAIYPDPEAAAAVANATATAYIEHIQGSRSRLGEHAKDNLSGERDTALANLKAAETALAEFKEDNQITSISLEDRQSVTTQNVLTLSRAAKDAAATRIALQATYRQAQKLHADGTLAGATVLEDHDRRLLESLRQQQVQAEREFGDTKEHWGEKSEAYKVAQQRLELVNAKIEAEQTSLLKSLAARLQAATESEKQLNAALEAEKANALALSTLERPYGELARAAQTAADTYALVTKRDTEVGLSNRVENTGVEVLDRATVPGAPVFPRRDLILGLAFVGGFGLGALIAVGIDLRDQRIRGLLDLERALSGLGLPVLGQLPLIPLDNRLGVGNVRAQRRQRDLYAYLFPQSLMAERCRAVRTALAFSQQDDNVTTLMVTSPGVGEGKSCTAINLAVSFCQAKKRVAIIDADMRRPRIHQVFPSPVEQEGVGLSSVLSEDSDLDGALFFGTDGAPENLVILPCGQIPDNPAELLESGALRRTLAALRESCDVIIIDSPPVLPVTDPMLLARHVDGVIVVAKCTSTTRGELRRAMGQLRQTDTNVVGVVLNEVDARHARYGYDYSYQYYYSTYRTREAGGEQA